METIKPGYKTTEFWICIVIIAIGGAMQSGAIADGGTVAKIMGTVQEVLAALGYTWSRASAKLGPKKVATPKIEFPDPA